MSVLEAYAKGELSPSEATRQLGPKATEHDLFQAMRDAHLPIPTPPRAVIDAEVASLERLWKVVRPKP